MDPIERRRHPRHPVREAVMIVPNGEQHPAAVLDISFGGARLAPSGDWMPSEGSRLSVYFMLDRDDVLVLQSEVVRLGLGQMGLKFSPDQDAHVARLLNEYGIDAVE